MTKLKDNLEVIFTNIDKPTLTITPDRVVLDLPLIYNADIKRVVYQKASAKLKESLQPYTKHMMQGVFNEETNTITFPNEDYTFSGDDDEECEFLTYKMNPITGDIW